VIARFSTGYHERYCVVDRRTSRNCELAKDDLKRDEKIEPRPVLLYTNPEFKALVNKQETVLNKK
jgi:hypothetical protein